MQKQRISLAFAILLVLALAIPANSITLNSLLYSETNGDDKKGCGQEGVTESCCKPPEASKDVKREYCYDAGGSHDAFDISQGKRDKIRIIIKNKNPFLYDYIVTVTPKAVPETALGAFLPLLSDFIAGQMSNEKADSQAKANAREEKDLRRARGEPLRTSGCSNEVLKRWDPIRKARSNLSTLVREAQDHLKEMTDKNDLIRKTYKTKKEVIENPQGECAEICKEAKGLLKELQNYALLYPKFEEEIVIIKGAARLLFEEIIRFRGDFPDCEPEDLVETREYARLIADRVADSLLNDFKQIVKNKQELDEAAKSIDTTLSSANAFTQAIELGPFRTPTDVSIKVERKLKKDGKDAKSETIIDAKANFGGGARFVLAGGLAFTNLQKQEFQRVQPASGDPIIGLKENSNKRIAPLVMLHTRILEINKSFIDGVHLSVGVTAKNDNKGTDIEYLLGPSISFAEERLFITGGAYAGKQQRLEGGFQLGSTLPMSVSEIPVRKEYHWKFGVSVTYKIK